MILPASNETSSHSKTSLTRHEPRCVLRGEISDEFGNGEFVLSRQHQIGFCETVDYETHRLGIEVINKFADTDNCHGNNDDQGPVDRLLECRYSVIAEAGCKVDHLKIIVSFVDANSPPTRITLAWRGEGQAKLVDPDNQITGRDDGSFLCQDETVLLKGGSTQNISTWHIEVPSHSVSLAVLIDDGCIEDIGGYLSIVADTVFLEKNKPLEAHLDGKLHSGTGRIQPEIVLEIIDKVENTIEQTLVDDVEKPYDASENTLLYSTSETSVENDTEYPNTSSSNIDVVVSQKIMVFHGEDIILGTEGMFINRVTGDASYISASLPDWLFLDQNSGDLMGTVPVHDDDGEDLEFSIYAVDGAGNSAKAVILVNCSIPKYRAGEDLKDYEFCEGGQVSIATKAMFIEFGLDTEGLQYTATGLPEGLSIGQDDGIISGRIMFGTGADAPYEIAVAAHDKTTARSETSMRFLLDVVEDKFATNCINSSYLQIAMNDLYRLNKDCEQILVANLAADMTGIAKGFSMQEMQLFGDKKMDEIDQTVVPMVRAFSPERHIFLQVHNDDESEAEKSSFKYEIQLTDQKELPDWIEFTPNGFVRMGCNPDRRYVDLELIQSRDDGFQAIYDICIDTFEGNLFSSHYQSGSYVEKQLREVNAA